MIVTLTFGFINAANQQINWAEDDVLRIGGLGLTGVAQPNAQQITGTRDILEPAPCEGWNTIFDTLSGAYTIFSDQGVTPVTRAGATCIGALITEGAVTLYLKRLPVPQAPEEVVEAAIEAGEAEGLSLVQQVRLYLVDLEQIRVYIPASQATGHQTTTCNIMRRLVAMGFVGRFEVVYVAQAPNANMINLLLPELNLTVQDNGATIAAGQGPDGTYSNEAVFGECSFLFTPPGIAVAVQRQLGISGGVDSPRTDPRTAAITNTQFFLMLQPFQWNAANFLYSGVQDNRTDLSQVVELGGLNFLATTCYYVNYEPYAVWNAEVNPVSGYVNRIGGTNPQYTQAAVTGIQAQCCAAGANFNLLPVYGLTAAEPGVANSVMSNWNQVTQISALANIVIAVLQGQAQAPLNRGTVIMTLDAYAATWRTDLQQLLPANLYGRLTFWQNGTAWDNANITGLGNTQVLIANIPKLLPMPVFNYFYLNSPMPPIFEGKGTTPLLLNSGRPYMQLSKNNTGVEKVYDARGAQTGNGLGFTIFPSPGAVPTGMGRVRTIPPGPQPSAAIAAGNAAVSNTSRNVSISAATFEVDDPQFATIRTYLRTNFYIEENNVLRNKFKVLTAADQMEPIPGVFPITQQQMYNNIQTACGGAAITNVCTAYRAKIQLLTTLLSNGTNTAVNPVRTYFEGLAAEFHDEMNDKLVKGLAYTIGIING
jgi:hypothetical protein